VAAKVYRFPDVLWDKNSERIKEVGRSEGDEGREKFTFADDNAVTTSSAKIQSG